MEQEKRKDYIRRVTQANRSQLVVITYEIINGEMKQAQIEYEMSNLEKYQATLKNAQKFLNELMGSLDYQFPVSKQLMQIYIYINKTLITAQIKKQPELLDSAIKIMEGLQKAFEEVEKSDTSGPVLGQSQKLYAGLTYGKGVLNEISVNINGGSRGYQA